VTTGTEEEKELKGKVRVLRESIASGSVDKDDKKDKKKEK